QNAGPEPAPARILLFYIQRAGAEFEDTLKDVDGEPQAFSAGEGPVKLDAAAPRRSRELHARKILTDPNLQIRKRLVVLQIDVKARLNVLYQPSFHQQRVDIAVRGDEINVGNELDQIACARVIYGRLGEIMTGPI